MSADAASRLRRLLLVLPVIATGEDVSLADLEARTGVDPATLLDDLNAVTNRLDDSGDFIQSITVRLEADAVAVNSSHFRRPMRLTLPELCALELGLAMLSASTPPDERAVVERARRRVRDLIVELPASDDPADHWHAAPPPLGDAAVLGAIRRAIAGRHVLRIAYRRGGDTAASDRRVRPYALVPSHGTWYLVARNDEPDGLRFFRADRIESAEVLADTFTPPEGFDAASVMLAGRPYSGESPEVLVVRYSPRVAPWIAEREGIPLGVGGSLTMEHPLADDHWAVRHVLQYGPEAEVIAPERIRRAIVERLTSV